MSGNGFEQVPHIQHAGPPVDHHHLADGIHGPGKHKPATKPTTDGSTGAGSRGQTEGGGGGPTKPTGGGGGSTEGGGGGTTEGGGGGTEGGGGGSKSGRQFAPTAQRHEFHPPAFKAEQTTVSIPGTPAKTDVYTTTTSQSASTTNSERTNSVSHTHTGYVQSSQSIHHDLKYVPGHVAKHEHHEIPHVHHHHHTGEHHPIHHHHVHHDLPHPHPTEHKHPIHHIHHHLHHPVDQPVEKTNHPHKEGLKTHIHPGHVVTHDTTTSSMIVVPKVTKREAQIVQEQNTTIHTETVRQKIDQKTVTSDSTVVVTTPATPSTSIAGPIKEHFQPTNTVQIEANNQGTNSLTLSRTLNSRDALSARVDFDHTKFGNLSIVDDHALFPTIQKDGEPALSNLYLQGGFFTGRQSTTEGLMPLDKAKLSPIVGLNGFTSLGHDRQLYGGLNWSPGEGFADAGVQQDFKSGYLYGGLQYSTLKGFSPTHSFEFGGSLKLGHGKNSPSWFVEGTVPFDQKTNQKTTAWTGLRINF